MAEFLVPKIINELSDVFLKQFGERVNLIIGAEEEVENLRSKLAKIEKLLDDAERRRLKDKHVSVWLQDLEDTAYEMEDVLDEWNIRILKPNNVGPQNLQGVKPRMLEKVRSLISFLCYRVHQVPIRGSIASKIKEINCKLEKALREANQFDFVISSFHSHAGYVEFEKPMMTTSIFDESEVHGREVEKNDLLHQLLMIGRTDVEVISIVGLGGSGKTTLAKVLFNDDRVKKLFQLRKWVCVSNPFDENRIARALMEDPEMNNLNNVSELESLLQLVKDSFSGKRYLIVLDDVWTEDRSKWELVRNSLKDGSPGSIILVTTRSERVARVVGSSFQHNLGLLSDSDSWLIIKRIALWGKSDLCRRVEKIGSEIAGKCKGLPLAAKTMGSLLQFKDIVQEWQKQQWNFSLISI